MKVFRLSELERRPVEVFESVGATAARVAERAEAVVTVIGIEPGGRLGSHPAAADQLFVIIEGGGEVVGDDGIAVPVSAGSAVHWRAGETHETSSAKGLTALVLEAERFDLSS